MEAYPDASLSKSNKSDILKQWKYRQSLEIQFWDKWVKIYLPTLQQRQKWFNKKPELKTGDIVLLANDQKRQTWPLGLVVETYEGRDGLIRSVEVKVRDKIFKRPVQELVLLECD